MTGSYRDKAASVCGLVGGALALVVMVVGGLLHPGYQHASQYISELGALDAPHGRLISIAGFLPVAALVLAFLGFGWRTIAISRLAALGCLLLLGVAAGYAVAAFAPCDPGCPVEGSARQALHNASGMLEYLGGGIGLLLIGFAFARSSQWRYVAAPSLVLGAVVLGALYLLGSGVIPALRGVWQRSAEGALFGWIALVSILLLRGRAG